MPNLSKEERLELIDQAIAENEKIVIEAEKLIKLYMRSDIPANDNCWELVALMLQRREDKRNAYLLIRQQILNEE